MTIEILIADDDDAKTWDEVISRSPHGTLFHSWNWLKVIEKNTHTKLYPVIGLKNNSPVGIFPVFFQRKGPVRTIFSPPPHVSVPYLGPVLLGEESLIREKWEKIYTGFQESVEQFIISDLKANYVSILLPPALNDPRPFTWSGYTINPTYDYSVDTSEGTDTLFKSLDYNKRAEIKKAGEQGMIVEIGAKKEYEKILELMDVRYAQQARFFTSSRKYFLEIFDNFQDRMKIFFVIAGGEVVTGIICLEYRDTLFGWIGNSRPKTRMSPSPNHLLFWEIVRYASEHGFRHYTIMGAAGNQRLHEFYAARFDPELKIRYAATRRTLLSGSFEAGYTHIIRPLRGKIRQFMPQNKFFRSGVPEQE